MAHKTLFRSLLSIALLVCLLNPLTSVLAYEPIPKIAQGAEVTAYDLIIAMNTLRMSYGLPALVEDPIINAVAQSTAQIMAANNMSWHIGDVSGRLASAGYGGGSKVWGTENFAVGSMAIDEIMVVWADPDHMIPAVNPAYCNIGAGVAKAANGRTYYILQAAYTASKACGEYTSVGGATTEPGGTTSGGTTAGGSAGGVSQIIRPVKLATPDAEGKVYHVVEAGQSFWAIAVAYQITIKDIETWNNISRNSSLQIGQKLLIPGSDTEGYATPTPVGMIQVHTPGPDGKIVHTVQSYQTLYTIADAYKIQMETILALNGIQADWPLQIGQELVIIPAAVTPSPTEQPLTPLEKLTPGSDGKYYHLVKTGESLTWIANLYQVAVADLMAWNGLNAASILQPNQPLLLQVTPPATQTFTPEPATLTPVPPSPSPSLSPTQPASTPTLTPEVVLAGGAAPVVWIVPIVLAASGLFLFVFFSRRMKK